MSEGNIRIKARYSLENEGTILTVAETFRAAGRTASDTHSVVRAVASQVRPYLQAIPTGYVTETMARDIAGSPGFSCAYVGDPHMPRSVLAFSQIRDIGRGPREAKPSFVIDQFGISTDEDAREMRSDVSLRYRRAAAALLYQAAVGLDPESPVYLQRFKEDTRDGYFFAEAGFASTTNPDILAADAGFICRQLIEQPDYAFLKDVKTA